MADQAVAFHDGLATAVDRDLAPQPQPELRPVGPVEGAPQSELRHALDRLLEHDWPRLTHVVIDITLGNRADFRRRNWFKSRTIEWHDLSAIPKLESVYAPRKGVTRMPSLAVLAAHLEHVAAHYAGLGARLQAVRRLAEPNVVGSDPAASRTNPADAQRQPPTEQQIDRKIRGIIKRKARRASSSSWPQQLRELVRSHGKEAYFLHAPVLFAKGPIRQRRSKDPLLIFDFNDPERYPELYRTSMRGHTNHLNEQGTLLYSRLLARTFHAVEAKRR